MPPPRLCACLLAPLALACGLPLDPERETDRPLQTDRLTYTLETVDLGLEVLIPFTYTNRTGDTVFVVNCNGNAPPSLEKHESGDWVPAWGAVVDLCLSPPIVIAPGEAYTDTLEVFGGFPDSDAHPQFTVDDVEGVYRLLWRPLHDYDPDRQGFGEPVPLDDRISNRFRLRLE